MTQPDDFDDLIDAALGEFHAFESAAPAPTPDGATVRARFQRRRRTRVVALSVLGTLLLVVPIAAFASTPRGNSSPPVQASVTPSPVMIPSSSPSATPSASPSTPSTLDGRLTVEQIAAAHLRLATGDCGQVVAQSTAGPNELYVSKLVYVSLDNDAEPETAAYLRCGPTNWRVIALDRRADDGSVMVLGDIVPAKAELVVIDIAAADPGIVVRVHPPGADTPVQSRTFRWNGSAFAQSGGPTSFPVELPTPKYQLKLETANFVWGQVDGEGLKHATITVTVKNTGNAASGEFWVALWGMAYGPDVQPPPTVTPSTWVSNTWPPPRHAVLGPGESATVVVTYTIPDKYSGGFYLTAALQDDTTPGIGETLDRKDFSIS